MDWIEDPDTASPKGPKKKRGGDVHTKEISAKRSSSAGFISKFISRFNPLDWLTSLTSIDMPTELLDEDDLHEVFVEGKKGTKLFLGTYTEEAIWDNFKQYGIIPKLHEEGFKRIIIKIDTSDAFVHRITLSDKSIADSQQGGNFLLDLHVRRKDFKIADFKSFVHKRKLKAAIDFLKSSLPFEMHLSVIEWMCMQNPLLKFKAERPQLPGQRHPGLGVGKLVMDMLIDLAVAKKRDGLLNIPEHFHNGFVYCHNGFCFLNPQFQGKFNSLAEDLEEDLEDKGLSAVSWAINFGFVKDKKGKTLKWKPEEQIYPTSSRMEKYFQSKKYQDLVASFQKPGRWSINWEECQQVEMFFLPKDAGAEIKKDVLKAQKRQDLSTQ